MKYTILSFVCLLSLISVAQSVKKSAAMAPAKTGFYQLNVYHYNNATQEATIDQYLQSALLPALHRYQPIQKVGVFKPLTNDTASDKTIYVLTQGATLEALYGVQVKLANDSLYQQAGRAFLAAPFDQSPITHFETILLKGFRLAGLLQLPRLTTPLTDHIYELRSYESATPVLFANKVTMFNEGGEIALFKKLNFNAIFYGEVVSGSRMPNLMYMTSFNNMQDREAHWKSFGDAPEWKTMSGLPIYQHNVAHIDITLMHATAYSDF